jgi:ATP-binding cassette subfamily E protein 1
MMLQIAFLSEVLCIGCGICVKKCPFEAINVINLPSNLERDTTHRYSANSFKLHRLPMPRPGEVLGLVGTNGIGKSTALKILANKEKPNLGRFSAPPDWEEILKYFRGSELQNYFTRMLQDDIKALIKPQYVDSIPRVRWRARIFYFIFIIIFIFKGFFPLLMRAAADICGRV